jgi:hypothetical protein
MPTLKQILADPTADWNRRPPASEGAIQALCERCDFPLPEEYLTLLRYSNGGEGKLSINPGWFWIYPAEEVIENNLGYQVAEFLPEYFAIGSSGGGEMLVLRKRDNTLPSIYMIPFIPMDVREVAEVAHDFEMFAMALGR